MKGKIYLSIFLLVVFIFLPQYQVFSASFFRWQDQPKKEQKPVIQPLDYTREQLQSYLKQQLEKLKKGLELLEENMEEAKKYPGHQALEKVIEEFKALISLIENLIKKLNDPNVTEEKIDEYLGWITDLANQMGREEAARILKQLNFLLITLGKLNKDIKEALGDIIDITKAAQKELLEMSGNLEATKAGRLKEDDLPVMPALIVPSSKRKRPPSIDDEIKKLREQMKSADVLRYKQLQRQLELLEEQKRAEAERKLNEAIDKYMRRGQDR